MVRSCISTIQNGYITKKIYFDIMDNIIKKAGHYFDLDQCERAYRLAKVNKTWHDYATTFEGWNEDAYYADFEKWWDNLSSQERKRIYFALKTR